MIRHVIIFNFFMRMKGRVHTIYGPSRTDPAQSAVALG